MTAHQVNTIFLASPEANFWSPLELMSQARVMDSEPTWVGSRMVSHKAFLCLKGPLSFSRGCVYSWFTGLGPFFNKTKGIEGKYWAKTVFYLLGK